MIAVFAYQKYPGEITTLLMAASPAGLRSSPTASLLFDLRTVPRNRSRDSEFKSSLRISRYTLPERINAD